MTPVLGSMYFAVFMTGLVWAALGVMAFWVWQLGKSASSWLLLIGVGFTSMWALLAGMGIAFEGMGWMSVTGAVCFTLGYYLSVKTVIDAKIAKIRAEHGAEASAPAPSSPPPSIGSVHVRT